MKKLRLVKPSTVQELADEYYELKCEADECSTRMAVLKKLLESEMPPLIPFAVGTKGEALELIPCQRSIFSLELAEKNKSLAKKLAPYVLISRSLDLPAARPHVDEKLLEPFIKVTEYSQLRIKKIKEEAK